MGKVCKEVQTWVEDHIEKPIETWTNKLQKSCKQQSCKWWCLCCNKWFCWLLWIIVKVVTWVVATVGKWVARVVCEIVSAIVDVIGFIIGLILSIPIIGGIIRAVLNWVTEVIWRIVGLPDFVASLVGIRPRKKMYFGVIVPSVSGRPLATDADIQTQVNAAIQFYGAVCNIDLVFTGICHTTIPAPDAALKPECGAGGFFNDLWIAGSFFELATATCKFSDGFQRIIGLGAEIVVFIVQDVSPGAKPGKNGCSFASTHNYVVIEAKHSDQPFVASHEMGHACWLPHVSDPANLMNPSTPSANPTLTNLQIALVRWSKHCVYF